MGIKNCCEPKSSDKQTELIIDQLKDEKTKLESEVKKYKVLHLNSEKECEKIKQKINELNEKKGENEKKITNLENNLKSSLKENNELKMKISQINISNSEKGSSLKKSIIELKKYEEKIKNELEILKNENEKIKKEKNQLFVQIQSLENIIKEYKRNEIILKEKINELEEKDKPILIGLNNIGATCYMNATLQCLSNTKPLTEYFLTKFQRNPNRTMANEYYIVIKHLWDRAQNNIPYSPNSFKETLSKENPLFEGIAANDSKDLINFLIERFHQELNEIKRNIQDNNNNNNNLDQTNENLMLNIFVKEFQKKYNSPISNLFYGIIETKSQCHFCKTMKFNFQVYSFLEFPLQQVNQFYYNNGKRQLFNNDGTNPDVNLYECFDYYRKVDLMNGDNQMYCNICNCLRDAYYSTEVYSAPLNLIINLNRGKGAVYECKVNFPAQLNLINYVTYKDGVTVFELYAVICHLGPSSMSGHFVAYCKNRKDNKWYLYNDSIVTKCTKEKQYQDGMPYILFYRAIITN